MTFSFSSAIIRWFCSQILGIFFLILFYFSFSSVHVSSVIQSCPTLCDPMNCSTPGLPVLHQLPEFIQAHVHRVGDAIQPSYPLTPSSPSALSLSQHQGLISNELSVCIRWPKYWSFSFSISPSREYSGLISLKIDWFDLLAVQGTFRSLLQDHSSVQLLSHVRLFATPWIAACQASLSITNSRSSLRFMSIESVMPSSHLILCQKASILWCSACFTVQLLEPYVTTRKTSLDYMGLFWQGDVSAFQHTVYVCHPCPAKRHSSLISWLQSPSAVILEPKKRKSVSISTISLSVSHAVMGRCHDLRFFNI